MTSRHHLHWSLLAALTGGILVVSGLVAPPAGAATARSLALSPRTATVGAGTAVTFTGRVTKSPRGSLIRVQRLSGSTWVNATSVRTTSKVGRYSAKVTVPASGGTFRYRAVAPATTKLRTAVSPAATVTGLRRTTASISAAPATIALGGSSTLSGTVTPFVSGTVVAVQRLSGGTWTTEDTASVSSSGGFSAAVSPTTTSTYRVAVPRAGVNAGTVSTAVTVTVTTVGPAATPPTITTPTDLPTATRGATYSTTLTKNGRAGTWSAAQPLPPGLSLDADTGVLSGVPTAVGTYGVYPTFTETSTGLSASAALRVKVDGTNVGITSPAQLPGATRGEVYSVTLTKTGGDGTWGTLAELPAGLTLDAGTGVLSGAPHQAGTFGIYPTFTETATGQQATRALTLVVGGDPLAVTTSTLPDAPRNLPYSVTLTKTGTAGTWSTIGDLPPGLALDPDAGVISGIPTTAATYPVYVVFTEESTGESAWAALALHVVAPDVTTTTLPDGTRGTGYSQQLTKVGYAGTWSLTRGALPPGLTLSNGGLVSGTPTRAGDYGFTVTFTETSTGNADSQQLLLHVSAPGAPVITTTSLPTGTAGTPYAATLASSTPGGLWSVSSGSLPPGITLNAFTGALSGTPTKAGAWFFIVKYSTLTSSNTKVLAIGVQEAPAG
ncbi:putative Ig domain-containing protein [Marmoricola sp. RAF53]|uniref:putative Ig domain-containing protein n=1 Tax=Marmoricola sp. RAF53 TaxID=3233059 RepID=UPI003F989006